MNIYINMNNMGRRDLLSLSRVNLFHMGQAVDKKHKYLMNYKNQIYPHASLLQTH